MFDKNLWNWLRIEKFPPNRRVCSELQSQNENAESAEYREKVNSSQHKMARVTSFEKKLIEKSFSFEKPKYEEKELSLSIIGS